MSGCFGDQNRSFRQSGMGHVTRRRYSGTETTLVIHPAKFFVMSGERGQNRTVNLLIKSYVRGVPWITTDCDKTRSINRIQAKPVRLTVPNYPLF
jgi:hypothetical protein